MLTSLPLSLARRPRSLLPKRPLSLLTLRPRPTLVGLVTHRSQPANENTNLFFFRAGVGQRNVFGQRSGFGQRSDSDRLPCKKALRLGHAQYTLGLRLGEGSFGTVSQAAYQGQEVVVTQ